MHIQDGALPLSMAPSAFHLISPFLSFLIHEMGSISCHPFPPTQNMADLCDQWDTVEMTESSGHKRPCGFCLAPSWISWSGGSRQPHHKALKQP